VENLRLLQLHTKVSGKNSKNQKIFFKGAKSESELDLFGNHFLLITVILILLLVQLCVWRHS